MSQKPSKSASADVVAGDKTTKQRRTIRVVEKQQQQAPDNSSLGSAPRDTRHVKAADNTAKVQYLFPPIF